MRRRWLRVRRCLPNWSQNQLGQLSASKHIPLVEFQAVLVERNPATGSISFVLRIGWTLCSVVGIGGCAEGRMNEGRYQIEVWEGTLDRVRVLSACNMVFAFGLKQFLVEGKRNVEVEITYNEP
jgi:hypothetical protein